LVEVRYLDFTLYRHLSGASLHSYSGILGLVPSNYKGLERFDEYVGNIKGGEANRVFAILGPDFNPI
jgi:hypothetical protein